jgi:hypothetical protein
MPLFSSLFCGLMVAVPFCRTCWPCPEERAGTHVSRQATYCKVCATCPHEVSMPWPVLGTASWILVVAAVGWIAISSQTAERLWKDERPSVIALASCITDARSVVVSYVYLILSWALSALSRNVLSSTAMQAAAVGVKFASPLHTCSPYLNRLAG